MKMKMKREVQVEMEAMEYIGTGKPKSTASFGHPPVRGLLDDGVVQNTMTLSVPGGFGGV